MRPIEFDSFAEDVELVLKPALDLFNLKIVLKDSNSFYCQNSISAIWIYYEGSTLQFILVDAHQNKHHIYEILDRKGLNHLVPVKVDPVCVEQLKKNYSKFNYEFYLSDLCWLEKIGNILIQYCQDELVG